MTPSPSPTRCAWALTGNEACVVYHDKQWGVPIHDDRDHFAMLTLESAQAGLSWQTILNKASGYKACFAQFDIAKVAQFDEAKIQALMQDGRIIRNLQKIRATVRNAHAFLKLQQVFGSFDNYIWRFVDYKSITNHWKQAGEVPATTPLAKHISQALKKEGFMFIGPTIIYAYMQAAGLVNDHLTTCFRHPEVATLAE